MESFAQQVLVVTEKVIGFILNWPFLLFVFLVWVVHRYREQIASILERRGTIKRSELSSAIREHLEYFTREVGGLKSEVASFSAKAAQLEAAQSEYRLTALLEPVNAKIEALQASLTAEFEPLVRDMVACKARVEGIEAQVETVSTKEAVEAVEQEMASFQRDVAGLKANMESFIPGEELAQRFDRVFGDLDGLKQALDRVDSRLHAVPSQEALDELAGRMDSLRQELAEVRRQLERPEPQAGNSVTKEIAERVDTPLEQVDTELGEPRQSVGKTGEPAKKRKKRKTKG